MALPSPSSTSRRDLGPNDLPPADSSAPTSQGGSNNEAKADVGRNTGGEVAHLLAKLEKEGVEIDGKIASIIDDGISRIKAEARSEKNKKAKRNAMPIMHFIGWMAIGYAMGAECYLFAFRVVNAKRERARHR